MLKTSSNDMPAKPVPAENNPPSPWNEDHQHSVLNLYLESPDKGFDDSDPRVLELSANIGRSPASISFKLANYRFLDSVAEGKGKKGMSGVSRGDVLCWNNHSELPLSARALNFLENKGWQDLIPFRPASFDTDSMLKTIKERSLAPSLLAKPFTILTGASGTGKTKLATSLADHLAMDEGANSAVVAVGADWTDNRSVLGFVNHLRTGGSDDLAGRPVFQTTPIVDLLLRADAHSEAPHFLILDEMNLSHVERYFADFLSAMEQDDGRLQFHNEGEGGDYRLPRSDSDDCGVPQSIAYPKNLFVIGTVNIDETTYMFSPKVLDRANVIEFTVDGAEFKDFLAAPHEYPKTQPAEDGQAEAFLALAHRARKEPEKEGLDTLPETVGADVAEHLMALFGIMQAARFEFAYRTANEINRYLRVCRELAENKATWDNGGWHQDLDTQVLQKILPKLHGSTGRIGKLLAQLALYCQSGTKPDGTEPSSTLIRKALEPTEGQPAFPRSQRKLVAMLETLKEEQFVSFIQ